MSKLNELHKTIRGINVIVYKTKKSELVDYMKTRLANVDIGEVRRRLSKIKGSLAEDIVKNRE